VHKSTATNIITLALHEFLSKLRCYVLSVEGRVEALSVSSEFTWSI
tara:strand:- start:76 stop:213 length:138 start_codon:yes stop_codon:yes gene_type:complete